MSCIQQLAVTGVRSFNPDPTERQVINFTKPVTIILGPNGSGKTTIIESIRNACTGDLPGQGRSFIHDPKVAGSPEVKAQVRLQFRASNKQQYLVQRSFQLTQKSATNQKFETLDASLQSRDPSTGAVVTQSYKCCDLDRLIPDLMGISKPILDNVAFLHQDDANWPLSDSATLKKKFDEIFSAARYTKALDDLRKEMKAQRETVREHTANLATFQEQRSTANQLRQQCEKDESKVRQLQDRLGTLQRAVEDADGRCREMMVQADKIQQLESQHLMLEGAVKALREERDRCEASLEHRAKDTDEELNMALARFGELLAGLRRRSEELAAQLAGARNEENSVARRVGEVRATRDLLTSQGDEHQRRVLELQSIVRDASERYDIRLPGHVGGAGFDEHAVLRFADAFSEKVRQLQEQRDAVRAEVRKAQDSVEQEFASVRQRKEQLAAARAAAQSATDVAKPKLRDLKQKYQDLEPVTKEQADAQRQVAEAESRIQSQHAAIDEMTARSGQLSAKYEDMRGKVQKLQEEAARRKGEQAAAHRLKLLREDQERFKKEAADMRARMDTRFTKLIGRRPDPTTLLEDVQGVIQSRGSAVERMQGQVMTVDREVAVLRQQQKQLADRIEALRQEAVLKETRWAHLASEHGKPLPELLASAQASEEKLRHSLDKIKAFDTCHTTFVQQAEANSCCPICDRGLAPAEVTNLQRHVKAKTRTVPAAIRAKEEALKKARDLVAQSQELMPLHRDVAKIRGDELPLLETKRMEAADRADSRDNALRDLNAKLEQLKFEERESRELLAAVECIRSTQRELTSASTRIAEEERRMAERNSADRPLDLVLAELEAMQKEMEGLTAEQQRAMRDADNARRKCGEQSEVLQSLRRACDEKQLRVDERGRIRREYEAAVEQFRKYQTDIQEIQAQMPAVDDRIERFSRELKTAREAGDRREAEITKLVETHQRQLADITNHVSVVRKHIDERKSEQLENAVSELARTERSLREQQEKASGLQTEMDRVQRQANEHSTIRANLEKNIAFRNKSKEVAGKERELAVIKEQIAVRTGGGRGCWQAIDKLNAEKGKLEQERAEYKGQLDATLGVLRGRQGELAGPKFDQIDERYASTLIRLAAAQISEDDMVRYFSMLDRALMQYHDQKISEVNEIIKDLWIRIYRGQDIDHIELRSDVLQEGGGKRRNYNYRVVMVKQGTALDMRGRCSAGQRVLASLVIRIALSQAFCCECGILALDEPTTNLDHENIFSLAHALVDLIRSVSTATGSNFQLIIITHDEQFVRQVGEACGTERVIHVTKDGEGEYTRIADRSLSEMT
eukprot:TRINITY_DN2024_c0_g1_i2.p1 TRINITY_DN2024_c0_g1~~TRINITY_DN2024_c0_g1_i2.p1  ORF type:complete len:1318 (+),score=467.78 TRINITY_DN2024_c0_g1_i2:96-4049(+)